MKRVLLLLTSSYLVSCLPPPPHPAVVAVRQEEQQLPQYLKSPALHNPHLRHLLSLTSLLHEGEKLVHHRETDDIDRRQIYNMLIHAGLILRSPKQHHRMEHFIFSENPNFGRHDFFEPPAFTSPEILQHL